MKRRMILIGSSALAILGGALAAWWFFTGTPEYSLRQLAAAASAHQRLGVEEYLDVHAVATSVVDDIVQKQMATALQSPDDNPLTGLGTALGMSMVQNMRPVFAARLEEAFWAMAGDDAARRASEQNTALHTLDTLKANYRGIVASERRGTRARVSVAFRLPAPDTSTTVLAIRLEKVDHHWRVIAVEGLTEALFAAGGLGNTDGRTPLQRAYIASMKSDLRNLVTAEEAYFADSVKYGRRVSCVAPYSVGAVNFCATTGNHLTGPTLSGQGWSATITNVNLAGVTCAIFVNTAAVAPATREGTPACQ